MRSLDAKSISPSLSFSGFDYSLDIIMISSVILVLIDDCGTVIVAGCITEIDDESFPLYDLL